MVTKRQGYNVNVVANTIKNYDPNIFNYSIEEPELLLSLLISRSLTTSIFFEDTKWRLSIDKLEIRII